MEASPWPVIVVIIGCYVTSSSGQNAPVPACKFVPVNNKTFVEDISQFFNKDSDIKILEYHVIGLNLSSLTGPDAYQPSRWYRTQGIGSSQLLLIYHFYYGLLQVFLSLSVASRDVPLVVSPGDCLQAAGAGEVEARVRDYLLQDFYIDETAVKYPFTYSDDVEICTAKVVDNEGWGRLVYRCCGYDSDKRMSCHDVYEGTWVWVLRSFILALTLILFLYFPLLIPKGYRIYTYAYYPPDNLTFNLIMTQSPKKLRPMEKAQILTSRLWKQMKTFASEMCRLQPEVIYTVKVKKVNFNVCTDKLLSEGGSAVSMWRSLFDAFVRCKLRHSDPLEDCCRTSICGNHICTCCPSWHAWLKPVRTVLVMALVAAPSLPFMYAMSADDLEYQNLSRTFEEKGLQMTFNFYVGPIFGKVLVAVLAFMYVLHVVILIIDGATDENISRLYSDVLDVAEKKDQLSKRMSKSRSIIRTACNPIRQCGILIIPIWILAIFILPIIGLVLFIYHAPMINVVIQAWKKLLQQARGCNQNPDEGKRFYNACEIFWFFVTVTFVFIVMTIGANFLVHVLAMSIVTVVVQADLIYRVVPVVLILLIYVRDSFSRVGAKYDAFLGTILGTVKNKESEDLRRECLKSWDQQISKVFKISPQAVPFDPDDEVVKAPLNREKGYATLVRADASNVTKQTKKLFNVKNSNIRLHLKQLLLFLNKDDFLFMSKKFLFHCCSMDCAGAPGELEENYIQAGLEFAKIGIFLLFVFLVVMAYGSAYYVSPTNHLFVTLVSGLIPLVIRNIFSSSQPVPVVNTSDYRFESQLKEKIESFGQSWEVDDIVVSGVSSLYPSVSAMTGGGQINSTGVVPNGTINDMNTVDLVLDLSDMAPDRPQTRRAISTRFGSKISPGCCRDNTVRNERNQVNGDVTVSTSDVEAGLPVDTPANTPADTGAYRWKQIARPYDNQAQRDQVVRDHEENKKSILHSIDAHIFENAIHNIINLTKDEEHDSDDEARYRRRSRQQDFYPPAVNDSSIPEVRSSAGGDPSARGDVSAPNDAHSDV
ncbi:uncharacterized protein LOC131939229 [Physella acuta]|uniref:uncharacterized protein LOC131939229 n=1 Tax=Physella acuta TaxID=109671 RepID=UPI0027DAF58D|nr:uncharacterized protein LOC131939229 [Physella acuta]